MQAPKPGLRLGDTVHLIGSNILGKVYRIESHADLDGRFWTNIAVEDSLGHRTTFSGLFTDNLIKYEKGK
jgi:hypothetical protein